MVSRLARRSGAAVVQIAELLFWQPDVVYHVGVGLNHVEAHIMKGECWPAAKLIGFEPNPVTYADIHATYPGELRKVALSNRCEIARFYQPNRHRDGSSLFPRASDDIVYEVEVWTLDALYPDGPGGARCLLWVDAEGNDLAVLEGAQRFIAGVQMVNIETTGTAAPGWGDQSQVDRWLREHGFRRQWVHTQRIHAGQQDCIYVRDEIFDPAICPCPCQLEGFTYRACTEPQLTLFEITVNRDLVASSKQGGRTISSQDAIVMRECTLSTRGKRHWKLRWCGYARNESIALDSARETARDILAGRMPTWVQVTAG